MLSFDEQIEQIRELKKYFNDLDIWKIKHSNLETVRSLLSEVLKEIDELTAVVSDRIIVIQHRYYGETEEKSE